MKKAISMMLVLVMMCAAGSMAESVTSKTTNDTTRSAEAIVIVATADTAGTSEARAIEETKATLGR